MNMLFLILVVIAAFILVALILKLAMGLIALAAVIFAGVMIYTALQRSHGGKL